MWVFCLIPFHFNSLILFRVKKSFVNLFNLFFQIKIKLFDSGRKRLYLQMNSLSGFMNIKDVMSFFSANVISICEHQPIMQT